MPSTPDPLRDFYTRQMFRLLEELDDGTWRGERAAVLWFRTLYRAMQAEAERERRSE